MTKNSISPANDNRGNVLPHFRLVLQFKRMPEVFCQIAKPQELALVALVFLARGRKRLAEGLIPSGCEHVQLAIRLAALAEHRAKAGG